MEKENYVKEIRAGLILLVGFVICIGIIYFFKAFFKIQHFYYIMAYIVVLLLFSILLGLTKSRYKTLNNISRIIFLPISIVYPLLILFRSLLIPILSFIFYIGICITVPNLCFKILDKFDITWLQNDNTVFFIKMTLAVFIAVLFNFQFRQFIYWFLVRINKESPFRDSNTDLIINYLLSAKNIRFLIYSSYVLLLFAINYVSFESSWLSESSAQDKAILQSFVVFIAFDRALTLLKDLQFKPSDFLEILVTSVMTQWQKSGKEVEEFKARQVNNNEDLKKSNEV